MVRQRFLYTSTLLSKRSEQEQDVGDADRTITINVRPCAIRSATEVGEQQQDIRHFDRAVSVDVFRAAEWVAVTVKTICCVLAGSFVSGIGVVVTRELVLAAGYFILVANPVAIAVAVNYAACAIS